MTGLEFLNKTKQENPNILELEIKRLMSFSSKISLNDPSFYLKEFSLNKIFQKGIKELNKGKPIEYILNSAPFFKTEIFVKKGVLIPRTETEQLCLEIAEFIGDKMIFTLADIGTGSGCISIFFKSRFPHLKIYAVEKSLIAYKVAKKNFEMRKLPISLLKGDALKPIIKRNGKIDALICNPPYITQGEFVQDSVRKFEPKMALYIQKKSLFEKIFKDIGKVARLPFFMAFEISPENKDLLKKLIKKYLESKFKVKYEFKKDLNGFDRFVNIYLN